MSQGLLHQKTLSATQTHDSGGSEQNPSHEQGLYQISIIVKGMDPRVEPGVRLSLCLLKFYNMPPKKRKQRMASTNLNVLGSALTSCSQYGTARTGYTRTGRCESHRSDRGSHHVCLDLELKDGSNFCQTTGQPNWCDEEHECHGKNGLCKIDSWCVCQWAFADVVEKRGCSNVVVDCNATSMRALEAYQKDPKYATALKCLKDKCGV